MRIEREHTAALIVDFQERLVPAIADHEALMERVQILLQGLKDFFQCTGSGRTEDS